MNKVAKILFWMGGITIFLGVMLAIFGSNEVVYEGLFDDPVTKKNWNLFWTYLVTGFVSGMLLIAFGEIINLLHKQAKIQLRIYDEVREKDPNEEEYLLKPRKDDLYI